MHHVNRRDDGSYDFYAMRRWFLIPRSYQMLLFWVG